MKSDCSSTEVAFLGDRDKIPEMTEFQFVVNAAPALRIPCGRELFATLEPLKFAVSVRIHWRCAVFKAGIESILRRRKCRRYDYHRPFGCGRSFTHTNKMPQQPIVFKKNQQFSSITSR